MIAHRYIGAIAGRVENSAHADEQSSLFNRFSTAEEVAATSDLTGKTVLVTGCNSGIGLETMRVLVMRGAHVVALARTVEKAAAACASVMTSDTKGTATPLECELEDFVSVVDCANSVQAMGRPLDIVICNAGIEILKPERINGLEKQFVVNHLSHFLLVNRVLSLVKAAPQGRIILVSSSFSYLHAPKEGIEFDNLSGENGYADDVHKLYGQSKLANVLFSNELSRRLAESAVTSNSIHPGYIKTNITRHAKRSRWKSWLSPVKRLIWRWRGVHFKSVAQGAATTCYVATHPALSSVSGQYFEDCALAIRPGHLSDATMAAKLWAVSEELLRPYLLPWE